MHRWRRLQPYAFALLIVGLVLGLLGLAPKLSLGGTTVRLGLLLMLAAMPGVIACLLGAAASAESEALAQARNDGYWLAINHVSRGLLDPQPAPEPGTGHSNVPDNVRPLRRPGSYDTPERNAL